MAVSRLGNFANSKLHMFPQRFAAFLASAILQEDYARLNFSGSHAASEQDI
jgi:hypothetical protein